MQPINRKKPTQLRFSLFQVIDGKRIQALQEAGRLILAGPYPAIDSLDPGTAGFSGSLIVAEFESLESAQAWADADPYASSGVYRKVTVRPFKKVLPV